MNNQDPRTQVVAKAVKDPAFRAELQKDAKKAIEQAFGVKLPGVSVKVVEDSASVVHLVLPPAEGALTEKELQGVAGGGKNIFAPATSPDFCNNTAPVSNC